MTIGIGGWGEPPQADVARAGDPAQSTSRDLTSSATAGPTSACCARPARSERLVFAFVSLDSIPLEPHFRTARADRRHRVHRARRGHVPARPPGGGVAGAVPADPRRPRLGPVPRQPDLRDGASPYPSRRRRRGAGRRAGPRTSTPRSCHLNRRRRARQRGRSSGPTPTSTTSCSRRAEQPLRVGRADRAHRGPARRRPATSPAAHQPAVRRRRRRGAQRRPLHVLRSRLRARRGVPEQYAAHGQATRGLGRVPRPWLDLADEADLPGRWSPTAEEADECRPT